MQKKHAYCIDCGGKSTWFNAQVTCNHSLLGRGIAGILISVFTRPSICPALRGHTFEQNAAKSHTQIPAAKCVSFITSLGVESNLLLYNVTAAPQFYETRGVACHFVPRSFCIILYHFQIGHFVPSNNYFVSGSFRTHIGKFVPSSTV